MGVIDVLGPPASSGLLRPAFATDIPRALGLGAMPLFPTVTGDNWPPAPLPLILPLLLLVLLLLLLFGQQPMIPEVVELGGTVVCTLIAGVCVWLSQFTCKVVTETVEEKQNKNRIFYTGSEEIFFLSIRAKQTYSCARRNI